MTYNMGSKEFRLGNLINYCNGGVFKVIGIHEFGLDVEDDNETTYMEYEEFEPIPLTEEWLVIFGFIQDNGSMCWRNEIDSEIMIVYETLPKFFRFYPRTNKIEYVHQLQNLFFALCGEELITKN